MDDFRYIAIEEALRALQASNEALHADAVLVRNDMAAVQSTANRLQVDVNKLQSDVTKVQNDVVSQQAPIMQVQAEVTLLNGKFEFFVEHYAKKVDVEMIRTELYKAMEAQTWRLITWITVVCSGLTTAVYFIARNVH